MKKLLYILLIIGILFIIGKTGILNESEELQKTRANYYEIYGEKAKDFIFSK